jgi:hypothetical protein
MRWPPLDAHRVLQVRAGVADGCLKHAKLTLAACPQLFPLSVPSWTSPSPTDRFSRGNDRIDSCLARPNLRPQRRIVS